MANNSLTHKNISNESCASDAISLYYDGDSLISGSKSDISTTSIDGYIATTQPEADLKNLLNQHKSYAVALKQWIDGIGDIQTSNRIDFIARKIVDKHNDDMFGFFAQLKAIENTGYKFDFTLVNLLMENCIQKYNMDFYQFIQTRIINKMPKNELDLLNPDILQQFVKVRLEHVARQRYFGLPPLKKKKMQ